MTTSRNAYALPMHQQVSEMLIREIAAGRMIEGEKLPPERDMAAGLGIAVGTLRKALGDLERKGLLSRIQGSGNYVRSQPDVASVYSMFRLELVEGGGLPTARVLSVDRLAKPMDLPVFGSSGEAHRIRRLRSLGGKPAALEEIWLDGSRRGDGWYRGTVGFALSLLPQGARHLDLACRGPRRGRPGAGMGAA